MISLIEDGHPEYEALLEYRNEIKRMRDNSEFREKYRKNQRIAKFVSDYKNEDLARETHRDHEVMGPFTLEARYYLLRRLLEVQAKLRESDSEIELISPEEIRAIEYLWMYDGGTVRVGDSEDKFSESDSVDKLIDRLLAIEEDMSDLSRRRGLYKKLETIIMEYTMNQMLQTNREDKAK